MLKFFPRIFSRFKISKSKSIEGLEFSDKGKFIPDIVDDQEKIVRVIYSPKNLNNQGEIRSNFYQSKGGEDEVSVIRLDYCSEEFCKNHGKKFEDSEQKRNFYGLAMHLAQQIRSLGSSVDVVSSKHHFVEHADIKIGFVKNVGDPLPSQYKYIVDELASSAKIIRDPYPQSEGWNTTRF